MDIRRFLKRKECNNEEENPENEQKKKTKIPANEECNEAEAPSASSEKVSFCELLYSNLFIITFDNFGYFLTIKYVSNDLSICHY